MWNKIGTHRDDTHNLCVFCLGKEHARDVLEGKSACTVSFFYVKAPLSSCPFPRKEGQPSASRDSGPTAAEARRVMKLSSWMWPMSEKERGTAPFRARRPRTRVEIEKE